MTYQPIRFYQTGTFTVGNRLLKEEQRSVQANMRRTNSLNSGHRACQGCGEALGARYAIDAAMEATHRQLVAANATGCLEVFSTPYPETSWQIPWIHSLFGNAAAVATGIAAAMHVKGRHDVRVVAQGGDGGTTDIGFGCLSGMFERNDDVLYICYDNEAYMNTGVQRSSATPPAARTNTTMPVGDNAGNAFGQGKNVPRIAMAHEIPYVATATVAELRDLEAKVRRAMEFRGARYIHILVPCPLGWGHGSAETIRMARLAKETGLFPVFEAERGEVTGVSKIHRKMPVEDYLRPQTRFAHLFKEPGRPDVVGQIQAIADRNIARYGLLDAEASVMKPKPFAITLDPGSSLANHTGSWRTVRPEYVDRLPPCNHACPAGENIQGWLFHAEAGEYEQAWRVLTRDNPLPAVMGRVCYHPCETRVQSRDARCVRRHQSDRALHRRRGAATGLEVRAAARADGQARAGDRRRAVGPVGRLPARADAVTAVTIHEAGPLAGGMMRFGIPKYRLPRDVLDAEIQRIVDLGVTLATHTKVTDVLDTMHNGRFDAVFLAVGAHIAKRAYLPAGSAGKMLDACPCCAAWKARSGRCSVGASSSMAAATRRSTSHAPRSGSARRNRSSSTGVRARRCRRTSRSWRRRCRKACW